MKNNFLTYAACAAILSFAASSTVWARAPRECTSVPQDQWMSFNQLSVKAEQMGYTLHKIERKGSCIEISGEDGNGARIKIFLDPVTGNAVPHDQTRPPYPPPHARVPHEGLNVPPPPPAHPRP